MKIRKAHKYRLKVNENAVNGLNRTAGCQRFLWNHFLALQNKRLEDNQYCLSYPEMCKQLVHLKNDQETQFLKEVPSQTLQQTLKDLDRAFKDAFAKKKGFPRFKIKGKDDSFRYPQGVKIVDNRIFLPRLDWFCFYSSCSLDGEVCNVTVSRRGKHWYVAVQVEKEITQPVHPSTTSVGIDMGVVRFATLSTGEYLKPLNSFQRLERRLRLEQQKLSRKKKFSNNWKKQKQKVQTIHIKIANARLDYLHKASTNISKNHAIIVMEDLKIMQMSSSKTGHRKLNKSILDQGWYEFRRLLEYKQLWRGGKVLLVDPANTSRTCPKCRHICAKNRQTQSKFLCQQCGLSGNADYIAACNILMAVGHTVSACGDTQPVAV